MDFGFVEEENPYDVVSIDLSSLLSSEDALREEKTKILQEAKLLGYPVFLFRDEHPMQAILATRIILVNGVGELKKANNRIAHGKAISLRNEKATLRILTTFLRKLLAKYATTLDEDKRLLVEYRTPISKRNKAAVITRIGEKEIIIKTINDLAKMKENLPQTEEAFEALNEVTL